MIDTPTSAMLAFSPEAPELGLPPGLVDPIPRKFCPPRPLLTANTDGSIVAVFLDAPVAAVVANVCVAVG